MTVDGTIEAAVLGIPSGEISVKFLVTEHEDNEETIQSPVEFIAVKVDC